MKNLKPVFKWMLLLLTNSLPFAYSILLYRGGGMVELCLTIPTCIFLAYLNYKATDKVLPYVLIQLYGIISFICAGYLSTRLYYNNVSSDPLTPIVGKTITLVGAGIIILIAIIAAIIKGRVNSRKANNEER